MQSQQELASQQTMAYQIPTADPRSGYTGQPGTSGQAGNWSGSYPSQSAGTGPNSYSPAPTAPAAAGSGYTDYGEQPAQPAGNPYGSYVSAAPADGYPAAAASHPAGDVAYGSYLTGRETQAYSQPPAAQAPVHAAPVYDSQQHQQGTAGYASPASYGMDYYNGNGNGGANGGPANGYAQQPGATGGYQNGAPGQPDYPPAGYPTEHYDQQGYRPADTTAAHQEQPDYGTPDPGYGAGSYGTYPGY
jgi:hypothetical protein